MPTLVFRLRNVPEDEAIAVKELLDNHHIQWYETSAGNWGIAMPGIWVKNDQDTEKARQLINTYQTERQQQVRLEYAEKMQRGEIPTLLQQVKNYPVRVIGIVIFCLFILYAMINPFLQLIEASV